MSDEDETKRAPADAVEAVRARLEKATRHDPRMRFRILVAAHVLLIVDRQIGRGEGPQEAEWERLGEMVKDHPGATDLLASLRAAVAQCDATIEEKIRAAKEGEGEGKDEAGMRKAILTFIRAALLEKLQLTGVAKDDAEDDGGAGTVH